ncbi:hypothetical protein DIE17_21715 [Burkholderia sp. Bp9099]|nr:hypothetical protein DIE17_21715 [Burkholderia sp. Bp9099]
MRKWGSRPSARDGCAACIGPYPHRAERPFAPRPAAVCRIRCIPPAIRRDRLRARPNSTRIAQFGFR